MNTIHNIINRPDLCGAGLKTTARIIGNLQFEREKYNTGYNKNNFNKIKKKFDNNNNIIRHMECDCIKLGGKEQVPYFYF